MRREWQAIGFAVVAAAILILLIFVGSRGLKDFDSALIGYAVATVIAFAGLVYRYTLWIEKPPTWRYFKGGWRNFLSWRNLRRYTLLVPRAWWTDILAQTFILRRSPKRWVMHMCIFWGVILSLAITLPLSFGWYHFTLVPPGRYKMWFFGLGLFNFPLETVFSFVLFHALDFTAILLLVGLALAFWRRTREEGLLATQRFGFDLMPLILLAAIATTGLALTVSYDLLEGRFYSFLTLTHQIVVIGWLLSLPFGKFFHIIERPATIGVTLYQQVSQDVEPYAHKGPIAACRNCGRGLPSLQFVYDLKASVIDLGMEYNLESDLGDLLDYCPTCKRTLRGEAYYQLMQKQFL